MTEKSADSERAIKFDEIARHNDHSARARTYDQLLAEAQKRGCDIVYPAADELFIDIDSKEGWAAFKTCFDIFSRSPQYRGASARWRPSPSGRPFHRHVVVTVQGAPFWHEKRIALQALLGSDPKREVLSHLRALEGDKRPVCFFVTKGTNPSWKEYLPGMGDE